MVLNITTHKTILFQILKDIYSDTTIAPFLGFKGGTAAAMFYGLDRFSVDLDFDLRQENKTGEVFDRITQIASKYGTTKESYEKRFNLFWVLSYEDKARNIKIEINKRKFGSRYEIKTYLGISMLVMVREDMAAHKLATMYERIGKTSRDLYDIWFFLKHRFPLHKELVEKRLKMPFNTLVEECIQKLTRMKDSAVLTGVGELLSDRQKTWAQMHLKEETIALLKLRMES